MSPDHNPPAPDDITTDHARPDGASDPEIQAAGTMSEAFEILQRARGHLYSFHQLMGRADLKLDDVLDGLRETGHDALADDLERELVGRNVLEGRWTFQIVEEFEAGYHACFAEFDRRVRDELAGGAPHVFEAEMKERRRTKGHPAHDARPPRAGDGADEGLTR